MTDLFDMFTKKSRTHNAFRSLSALEAVDNGDSFEFEFDEDVTNTGFSFETVREVA